MNVTEPLINAALLGTAAKKFTPVSFPASLEETFHRIQEKAEDAEAAFYQMAALTFAYSRAGLEASSGENSQTLSEAPEDEKPYFDGEAGNLLNALHRNKHLLLYAYQKAVRCNKLIPPLYLQSLITRAFDRNNPNRHQEQQLLSCLAGKRGHWLLAHMELPDWGDSGNETWETALPPERKRILCRLRKEQPEQGIALLQTELKNESAFHRGELIECLHINLSKADEPFLQSVADTDRSSYVQDIALSMLIRMPDSEPVQKYCELLRGKLQCKMLLGWSYGTLPFTPELKKLGLEEVSPNKEEKDEKFLLRQLAERVPLSFWAELYGCSPEKAAGKLAKKPPFGEYFKIHLPIKNFGDSLWAYKTLKEDSSEDNVLNLIGLLTPEQREEFKFQISSRGFDIPESWFNDDRKEWGIKFSTQVMHHVMQQVMQGNYYYYPQETLELLAIYFPQEIEPKLNQYVATQEAEQSIAKIRQSLTEYISIKQRINILFNENK